MRTATAVLVTLLFCYASSFGQDSTASAPLSISAVTGGFCYHSTTEKISGTYIYGGIEVLRVINPKLSVLGIGTIEVSPNNGAWGPAFIVGAEFPIGSSVLLDVTVLAAKDIGPIRGPWVIGPGVALLVPTKKGGTFGPTFGLNRATTGGPNFINIGLVLTGLLL